MNFPSPSCDEFCECFFFGDLVHAPICLSFALIALFLGLCKLILF
jgi:hypothetical protein